MPARPPDRPPLHGAWRVAALAALVLTAWVAAAALSDASVWAQATIEGGAAEGASGAWPWWVLPVSFFAFTSTLGVLSVMAGMGGGVLFVSIVAGVAPFVHLDFVRGTGLLVALTSSLVSSPELLRRELVNLRMAIPLSLSASLGSIAGALVGLALPQVWVQLSLGTVILVMAVLMATLTPAYGASDVPARGLTRLLGIEGREAPTQGGEPLTWRPRSMGIGLGLFGGVGVVAGMFGLGAGWANVPVLNLVLGVPLRSAVATSNVLLATTGVAAVLVYLHRGAVLPLIAVPSVLGIMIGARIGTWLLVRVHMKVIRRIVIGLLLLAGLRALLRGLGI